MKWLAARKFTISATSCLGRAVFWAISLMVCHSLSVARNSRTRSMAGECVRFDISLLLSCSGDKRFVKRPPLEPEEFFQKPDAFRIETAAS